MRRTLLAVILGLCSACTNATQVSSPPPASHTEAVDAIGSPSSPISVDVLFPESRTLVVGDVAGQVINQDGDVAADFVFESGWIMADDWRWGDPVEESGAATAVTVKLPGPGLYTFQMDPYVLSNRPCGTCESSYAATSITQDVVAGKRVQIPPGANTGLS